MKCLELLGILRSLIEKGEGILTAALRHLSALPVPLLRQVSMLSSTSEVGSTWKFHVKGITMNASLNIENVRVFLTWNVHVKRSSNQVFPC